MEPLTPAVFYILLSLVHGEKHGYAIMQDVEISTGGEFAMGPGTLYGTLKRMLRSGLVVQSDRPDGDAEGERRRYYRLTPAGRHAAKAEALRLSRLLRLAADRSLLALRQQEEH
jgi:DNA-binding PadR family transcriptional regulator